MSKLVVSAQNWTTTVEITFDFLVKCHASLHGVYDVTFIPFAWVEVSFC